jgi:NarL family two-component system response regulator LiaR
MLQVRPPPDGCSVWRVSVVFCRHGYSVVFPIAERIRHVNCVHNTVGSRIRVLIADDHIGVRRAIATFVIAVDDLELAGEAASGEEVIRLCARILPDVVLMDASLPDMTGAAATLSIHQCWPDVRVIAMCTFQEEEWVPEMLQAGAVGYVLKNVSANEFARAIRAAHAF